MIYTSYFAAMRKMTDEQKAQCVSIARWTPRGIDIPSYLKAAPPSDLLKDYKDGTVSKEYVNITYSFQLSKLTAEEVAKDLDGKILLCFEKPGDFCHRHILAEWLRSHGYECEELFL